MMRSASFALCLSMLLVPRALARVWWVAPSSSSLTRLGTAAYPLVGVQTGLDSARTGDTVVLQEGTYTGNGYDNHGVDSVVLGSRMLLDGDTAHASRTVLDGQTVDTVGFAGRPPILGLTLADTAAYRIVGLTFRRGGSLRGGAVRISASKQAGTAGAVFVRASFLQNVAVEGGAVWGGRNRFQGCLFSGNRALQDTSASQKVQCRGGAFAADSSLASATGSAWDSCVFMDNRADEAGAIREWKASIVRHCRFERNTAALVDAGAIRSDAADTTRIVATTFSGNIAKVYGGALRVDLFHASGCLFEGNQAQMGGALFSGSNARSRVEGSRFLGNNASIMGGAVMVQPLAIEGSEFIGNSARDGGAFYATRTTARRSIFLRNEASREGGMTATGSDTLVECLVDGNTAPNGGVAFGNRILFVNSTVKGATGAPGPDLVYMSVEARGSILDVFQQSGTLKLRNSLFRGTRTQMEIDTANSRDYLLDVDPQFLNPQASDLRLKPTSPAIDRDDTGAIASAEPLCVGRKARRDLGYYGNTAQSTCPGEDLDVVAFEPKSIARILRVGEVLRDSTRLRWTGTGSLDPDSSLSVIGTATVLPPGALVDGLWLQVRDTARAAGALTSTIRVRARAAGADEGCVVAATVLDQPVDSIFGAVWYSRGALLGSTVRDTFLLVNRGANAIRIDSAGTTSTRFQVQGVAAGATIPVGGSLPVVVAFTSNTTVETRARLRLWSRSFARPDTGVLLVGSAYDAGSTPLPPVAVIDTVEPRRVEWNGTFSAVGVSWDADAMGGGVPIVSWRWVVGADTLATPGITGHPASRLSLGWNRVSLRVRDNEGVWSPVVTDSVFVVGALPVFDSVRASRGIVLRQDGDLELSAVAHDADEGAVAGSARDGIARIVWKSGLDGILDTGAAVSIAPGRLRLGTHAIWAVAYDDDGDSAVSDTLRIPVQTSIGLAVVVAGTSFGDISYHRTNISPNANWIYQTLRSRGYSDEQIWYANRIGWQSLGDPFVDAKIVDETAITRDALRRRLLAFKSAVEAGTPLLVALVGHGDASEQDGGRFFLNDSESITPWDLNNWFGEYDGIDSSGRIVVVLDFCEAGSFQTALRTGFDRHRVVVTSADAEHPAYFVRGKGFSQVLFAGVRKGRSLARSFQDAKSWSDLAGAPGNLAGPLLNADMNGSWNADADYAAAASVWIGGAQQNQDPEPGIDSGWIASTSAGAVVAARLAGAASRAWIEYRTGSDDSSAAPRVVPMSDMGDGIWSAEWSADSRPLELFVHASSPTGALAFPWAIDVAGLLDGGATRMARAARFDRGLGRIVLARRIGAGEALEVEILDVGGRRLGAVSAQADANGWVEASWRPVRSGFHLVRLRWPSGSGVERVLVAEAL